MNLVADIGNSGVKLALFDNQVLTGTLRTENLTTTVLDKFCGDAVIEKMIVSGVKDIPGFLEEFAGKRSAFYHLLTYRSVIPFSINYKTPETLGTDRIAALAGAFFLYPGSDMLVIDAGTAITFDYIINSIYEGGNISPGIDMRFKALNSFTGRLPLLTRQESFSFPGETTNDAIIAGVVSGVVYEINEYIRTFEEKHRELKVILTGGDGVFLKKRLEAEVIYVPDLVTIGLNFILEKNAC
ncbi:MAG: type III pantothenate kinase [Bacteroidales bacterium]